MINRLLLLLHCCALFSIISCTKTDPAGTGTAAGGLRPFNVTVIDRTALSAVIQWDSCVNTINTEVPKYKVILQDKVYHTNLAKQEDSLYILDKDTVYNGKVVAYISTGDSVYSSFTISVYQGTVYTAISSYWSSNTGRLASFNAYPVPNVPYQPTLWQAFTTVPSPSTLSNDTLFTVLNRRITATNAKTGVTLWQTAADLSVSNVPTYSNGRLYANTNLGLAAINAATGQIVWTFNETLSGVYLNSTPVVDGNKVFIAVTNYSQGEIHGVDVATGRKVWSATFSNTICDRPLAINGVVVVVSNDNGIVTAYDANTGSIKWMKTGLGKTGAKERNPVFSEGNVLIETTAIFYALHLQTGAVTWQKNANELQECVAGNGRIYFTMANTVSSPVNIYCVNAKTGQIIWTSPPAGMLGYSNLVLAKDRIYCLVNAGVYSSNTVRTFNAITGKGDMFFAAFNPVVLAYQERIHSFIVQRDGVAYYSVFHGNYK